MFLVIMHKGVTYNAVWQRWIGNPFALIDKCPSLIGNIVLKLMVVVNNIRAPKVTNKIINSLAFLSFPLNKKYINKGMSVLFWDKS